MNLRQEQDNDRLCRWKNETAPSSRLTFVIDTPRSHRVKKEKTRAAGRRLHATQRV